jgi:hypothetical protein
MSYVSPGRIVILAMMKSVLEEQARLLFLAPPLGRPIPMPKPKHLQVRGGKLTGRHKRSVKPIRLNQPAPRRLRKP